MLEIKSYDDWSNSEEQLQSDPVDNLKNYADYVRSGYYKAGMLNEENEKEIISGVQERAISDGLITKEMPEEEQNQYLSNIVGPTQNTDTNARFVLDHFRTGSEAGVDTNDAKVATLTRYLALKQTAPDQVSDIQPAVDELLADKSLVKRAKISAVDRGDYSVAAIDEDDGSRSLYTGPTAKPDSIKGEVDSLIASGAIAASDLYRIDKSVKPINGGLGNASEDFRFDMFRRTVGELAKTDKDLGDLIQSSASAKREEKIASHRSTTESIYEGAKTALAYPFIKIGEAVVGAGNLLMGEPEKIPAYTPDTKVSDALAGNDEIRKKFSPEEIEKFSNDLTTTAAGAAYRADKPETGIDTDSMGNVIIAPQLLANKQVFEQAVTTAPLNQDQQKKARLDREVLLAQAAPDLTRVILEEEPEAVDALAKANANGLTKSQFVEQWVGDAKNYDGFNARLEQFGKSAWKTVAEIPLGLAALGGNEWATKQMVNMAKDQSRREEYSRLFGDEFGLGFQMINTVPQVATDIALTIGTGGVFAGAKTLVKAGELSARSVLRASAKFALSSVDEAAATAFRSAAVAGGEAGVSNAIKAIGTSLATKFAEEAPVFTTSFIRSATSTYGSIYSQMPDTMSHEEKHKNSLGYALAAGLSTGVITSGMGLLGAGGVEEIATKRVRAMLAGETDESILASGGKVVPVDKMNYRQAKQVYESLKNEGSIVSDASFQQAMRSAIGTTYKNWLRTTLGGALHESIEESLDQAIQMKLEDAALDKETPLSEKVAQVFTAGLIGGAMGGASGGATQFGKINKSEQALVFEGRASALDSVAKQLRKTNSNATADYVQRLIDDARAKASTATQADIQAQEVAKSTKGTVAVADPKEKPVIPIDTFLQAFFGKPKGPVVNEVQPTTLLTDLIGEPASVGEFSGVLELSEDNGNVYLKLDKPYKQKGGEPVTHMDLGPRLQNADKVITKFPTLMRMGQDVFNVKAGTPYFLVGSTKMKFAVPVLREGQLVDNRFDVFRDDEGKVRSITINNAISLKDGIVKMNVPITNPSMVRALAQEYNIDITPTPAEGQMQFGFAEGKISDAETAAEEEPAKGTEGQLDFNFDQSPEQRATQAVLDRFDAEIEAVKEKLKNPNLNPVRAEAAKATLKKLQKEKRSYSAETIQIGMLSPEGQAQFNTPDVEWNTKLDLIRAPYDLNQDVSGAAKKIFNAPLRSKIGTTIALADLDSNTLDAVEDMANEVIGFTDDADDTVSENTKNQTREYYSKILGKLGVVREYVDEREIESIKADLIAEGMRVTQQAQQSEKRAPKGFPVTSILNYLLVKKKLPSFDVAPVVDPNAEGVIPTKQTFTEFNYIENEGLIEITDADTGFVSFIPLKDIDVSSKETQTLLKKYEGKAKEFAKEQKQKAKAAAADTEDTGELDLSEAPEIPLLDRVTSFLSAVTSYVDKFNELNAKAKEVGKDRYQKALVEAELKAIRTQNNKDIKKTLASLVAELNEKNIQDEDYRLEMVDQMSRAIFGKGGYVRVSKSKANFDKILDPIAGFKSSPVVFPKEKFREGTEEEEFFNGLVLQGQVVNLPIAGRNVARMGMFTSSDGLRTHSAFSEAEVERVTVSGQETAKTSSYIKDKNNLLREKVHELFKPTGAIVRVSEGPQGTKVNPRKQAELESKMVELVRVQSLGEIKGQDVSDKVDILKKEIAALESAVKLNVPKYKIGRDLYDMVRSQDYEGLYYPVTEDLFNTETRLRGVFTNDLEMTRAQIEKGLIVKIPKGFVGKNPAIHVAEDGVTVDGFYEPFIDEPVIGAGIRSKLSNSKDGGDQSGKTRTTKFETRKELFLNSMVNPADIKLYNQATAFLGGLVVGKVRSILFANKARDAADIRLPLTQDGIDDTARAALEEFMSQLNEYRLAKHVVKKVLKSIDWKTRITESKDNEIMMRALDSRDSDFDMSFKDLPQSVRDLLIKESTGGLTDAVKSTPLDTFVRELFIGLDDATLAKKLVSIGVVTGSEPKSIIRAYGMYLFQNAFDVAGRFYTPPDPRTFVARTEVSTKGVRTLLSATVAQLANTNAAREQSEKRGKEFVNIDLISEFFGTAAEDIGMMFSDKQSWEALNQAHEQRMSLGVTLNDYTDNPFNERYGIALSPSDAVFHDRGEMLSSELMKTIREDDTKELGKAFRDIANLVGLDTPARLAQLSDENLVSVLAAKLSSDSYFRTDNGYANIAMSLLSKSKEGQKAAGLMIMRGWLPSVMIDGNQMQILPPSVAGKPAAPIGTPIAKAISLGQQKRVEFSTGRFVPTTEEVEAYETNRDMALTRVSGVIAKLGEEKAIALQTIERARADLSRSFMILDALVRPETGPESPKGADRKLLEKKQQDEFWDSFAQTGFLPKANADRVNSLEQEITLLSEKLSSFETFDEKKLKKAIAKQLKILKAPAPTTDAGMQKRAIASQKYGELIYIRQRLGFNRQLNIDTLNNTIQIKQDQIGLLKKPYANNADLLDTTLSDISSILQQLKDNQSYVSRLSDNARDIIDKEIRRVEYLMSKPEWERLAFITENHPAKLNLKPKQELSPEQKTRVEAYNKSIEVKNNYDREANKRRDALHSVLVENGVNTIGSDLLTTYIDPVDVVPAALLEEETTPQSPEQIAKELQEYKSDIEAFESFANSTNFNSERVEIPELPIRTTESGQDKILSKLPAVSYESVYPSNAKDYPVRATMEGIRKMLSRTRSTDRKTTDFSLSTLDPALRDLARQENQRMVDELGLVSGDSNSILNALAILYRRGTIQQQAIVSILNTAPDLIRGVNLGIVDIQASFAGLYDKSNNTILLNLSEHNGRGLADVLLHELIHAVTVRVINNPTTPQQRAAVQRLEQIRNFALASAIKNGTASNPTVKLGLSNLQEFVTYALTAPEFTPLLNGLTKPQERTILRRMVDAVLSIFGFEPKSRVQTANAINELLDFTKMSLAHANTFNMDMRWAESLKNESSENAKASNAIAAKSAEKIKQSLRNVEEGNDAVFFSETQGQGTVDVVSEMQRILPEGITLEFDNTMLGQLGARRSRPNSIIVNPDTVNDLVYGLTPANARSAVRTFVDEELAHLASYRTFTEDDFTGIAANMGDIMRGLVADMLYSNSESDYTKRQAMIAADLESGALRESDIAAEWVRSQMTRIAVGRSREEHLAFLRTNPSLLAKFIESVRAFITKLKEQFTFNPTTSTAAKISMASREFRSLRNGGVLPTPELSTAGELGDSTHFINAVEGNVAEGQEDRTSFQLPTASTNPSKIADFWKKVQEKMYDLPLELRKYVNQRDGAISNIEYTMEDFAKKFPKLRDTALNSGIAIEDIGMVLGTTAPAVQGEARKELQRRVRQFKADNAKDPNVTRLTEDYEAKLAQPIADQFYAAFRKEQMAMEEQLKAKGFSELVDYLVEFRQEINKYKQIINFDDTNDVYLTRTFNYFSTEGWALAAKSGGIIEIDGKTVDFNKLRAAAATHFEAEVIFDAKQEGQTLTEDQLATKVVEYLDAYLIDLDKKAKESKELGSMNTIKRDVNRLLHKKDIDEPLRELLGEVTDPFENAVRTIYSVGRLAANDRFLRNFSRQAIKSGFASYEQQDGMDLLFHPSQNAELGDLAGLYVRSDVAAAIRQELGPKGRDQDTRSMEVINSIGKGLAWVSGAATTTQTLGSVGFYPRNILGGMALSAAQGIVNPLYAKEATRIAARATILPSDTKETRDTIRRLTELQVLRDETRGRIAMDMFRGFSSSVDEQLEELLNEIVEVQTTGNISKLAKRFNLKEGAQATVEFLASLNNVIDSSFKVNAYMSELDQLKKAYPTESVGKLEVAAARKVKLTFPTHSDQVSFAKSFNKSPFAMVVLPFIRWKSEVLRTMFNTIPLAMEEINSGNDVMRARGIKRLIGFSSTVLGGGTAFGLMFGTLFSLLTGGDDDKDKDKDKQLGRVLTNDELGTLREGLPDYQRNHGVFARLIGKDGIQVIDLSNILPHSQVTDIFKLGAQGNIKGIGEYIAKDLIGTQIAANAVFETARNEDAFGNPIALQSDNVIQTYLKLLSHVAKSALEPSVIKKGIEVSRYGQQDAGLLIAGELTGARPTVMKKSDIEYRAMSKIKNAMDEDVALLNPIYSAKGFDVGDVKDQVGKYQSASNVTQGRLYKFIQGMKALGSNEDSLMETGKRARISDQRLGYALIGENYPWVPNKAALKKVIENKTRGGEQDPAPLVDELIRVTSPNKSINYNVAQPFIK